MLEECPPAVFIMNDSFYDDDEVAQIPLLKSKAVELQISDDEDETPSTDLQSSIRSTLQECLAELCLPPISEHEDIAFR